ncbi:hypothetical protein HJC23_011246 [Cyclotella cryptica]|uniref:Phosphatidylinositol N-acetylglucosaminyltransferase n=1 Tax=Cyclotella cryptica TaxID=29204 RepID=A0ABD3QV36_9STRA
MSRPQSHCLWRPLDQTASNGSSSKISAPTHDEEEREFHRIRSIRCLDEILRCDSINGETDSHSHVQDSPLVIIRPPPRSLVDLMNSSLVVGQELALTAFLLAVHRVIIHEESTRAAGQHREVARQTLLVVDHLDRESSIAMVLVYATLLVIVYFNQKSLCQSTTKPHEIFQTPYNVQQGQRRKAMVRMSDAILLAAILRLMSGVIHTLTASYSSDTVYALSITGLIIHLLACDYNYANGISIDGDGQSPSLNTFAHPRPAFLGGTVSLNAVFFSTALLVSRIQSDASSYAFVSLVVTLFAFYPATRHNIARGYPNTLWGSPCFIITLTLSVSVWLITTSLEKIIFLGVQWIILILSPCIQWNLQKHKQIIMGPWDIAHVSTVGVGRIKYVGNAANVY